MAPNDTNLETKLKADYSWLTHHLILLAITGVLIISGIYGVESIIVQHDEAAASKYSSILAAQVQQTQVVEKQLASDEEHWTQVEKSLLDQNAQLSKTIATERQQIEVQRKVDATLNAQQAAERLTQQTKASVGEIVANGDNVIVDLPITRGLVSDLDLLDETQVTLAATQTQLANETTIADNAKADSAAKSTVITNLQAQNDAQVKSCDAQIAVVKAKARRSKLKSFAAGFVAGITLGIWKF